MTTRIVCTEKLSDYPTLFSISNLLKTITQKKDLIIEAPDNQPEIITPKLPKTQTYKKKQPTHAVVDFKMDDNIIFIIHNSAKLNNFLSYFKRPCDPSIYMFVEGTENVVFIASSASSYPIIIAKFPISPPNIIATQNENCYEFPLKTISSFIQKSDRANAHYSLILRQANDGVVLEYKSLSTNTTNKTNNIIPSNKLHTLQEIFFNKIRNNGVFEEDIGLEIDYNFQLKQMRLLMLTNVPLKDQQLNTINKRIIDNSKQSLKIVNNEVILTQETAKNITTANICKKNECLIWEGLENNTEYNMIKYTSLFRNYDKIIQSNDNIYYALCSWRELEKHVSLMFIKIITPIQITKEMLHKKKNVIFNDLFSNDEIIFECYLVHSI